MKPILILIIIACAAQFACGQAALSSASQAADLKQSIDPKTGSAFPKPGEWPSFRRSGSLEARTPLQGRITQPKVIWKEFVGALETLAVIELGNGNSKLMLPGEGDKPGPDSVNKASFIPTPSSPEEDNSSVTSTYADIFPEYPGKEKLEFESAFALAMTNGQWPACQGTCYGKKGDQWVKLWETKPMLELFNPLPIVGDFDGDGTQEIAILPFYQLKLIDAKTGIAKDSCRFNENRSYGFHGVYDFNNDGKIEFLIQADFSKHVDVLGFRDGKLSLLWTQDVEQDIADPKKILRVAPNPTADIDGDGRLEVMTTIYNDTGDGRWHLTFLDGMTGVRKADFPDEVIAAPIDLDGDGTSELLTTVTSGGGMLSKIRVRSMKGQSRILWEKDNASWQTCDPPLPPNVKSMATLGQRTVLHQTRNKEHFAVIREATDGALSVVQWTGSSFKTLATVKGEHLEGLGFDATGRLLVSSRHQFGKPSSLAISNGKAIKRTTKRIGFETGPAIVAWPDDAKEATIVVQGAVEEQVTFHPPKSAGEKLKFNHISGRGQGSWWPRTYGPVVADLAGDGRRQVVVADAGPSGSARLSVKDLDGKIIWQHEFPKIAGTPPPQNTGGVILWQAGHFTDPQRQDILVTTQRSKMHSEETYLLSGSDGHEIWHRDKQISKRAVGGNSFAIADYDGDGLDDLASLWPSIFYQIKGSTGKDIIAMDATWKQVYAKQVYFGQAVAGNFMNDGQPSLFFSGRLMTGVIRKDGTLVWFDALDKSPAYLPNFGDFDKDGRMDVIGVGFEDGIRCYDTQSGKVKWKMANPADGFTAFGTHSGNLVLGTATGDLDGDGRDEAMFVVDHTLYCVGSSKDGTSGELRWKVDFPSKVGPPTVVTLDKEGTVSILTVGDDGNVYCLR